MINPVLEKAFAPYLMPNERLLWVGTPEEQRKITSEFMAIPLVVLMIILAVFYCTPVNNFTEIDLSFIDPTVSLFLLILTSIVVFSVIFASFSPEIFIKNDTSTYGVTEQRILILQGETTQNLVSLNIKTLLQINFIQNKNQKSSITFGNDSVVGVGNRVHRIPAHNFREIDDAATVYQLILKLQQT
jgi:hypothetical protein